MQQNYNVMPIAGTKWQLATMGGPGLKPLLFGQWLPYVCPWCQTNLVIGHSYGVYKAGCLGCGGSHGTYIPPWFKARNIPQLLYKIRHHYRRATAYINGYCRNYFARNSTVPLCPKAHTCKTHSIGCNSTCNLHTYGAW
jgi:hypothetical protein